MAQHQFYGDFSYQEEYNPVESDNFATASGRDNFREKLRQQLEQLNSSEMSLPQGNDVDLTDFENDNDITEAEQQDFDEDCDDQEEVEQFSRR
jgi:hypothetical protein